MINSLITKLGKWPGRWFGLATLIWLGMMFWFSSQPATESSQLSGHVLWWLAEHSGGLLPRSIFTVPLAQTVIRKTAHFLNYMILGVWVMLAGNRRFSWRLLLFGILAASFDETHQLFVPGRSGELRDVLLDLSGFVSGTFVIQFIFRVLQPKSQSAAS